MTEIEQAQQFIRLAAAMTPKQQSALLQAMQDFNAGRCTFEELKVRTTDCHLMVDRHRSHRRIQSHRGVRCMSASTGLRPGHSGRGFFI